METWVDLLWNPMLQIWVYALIALSFSKTQDLRGLYVVVGMIFWNIIWIGQYSITVGALWEIWARSFSSMFISPLSMEEFIVGQMISGTIKAILTVGVSAVIGYLLYQFSIFSLGWPLIIYFFELLIFSWAIGVLVLSLIFRYSTQVQSLSWAIVFLVQPFGAVFYPVTILPVSVRWISYGLPVTYVFETMRAQLAHGTIDWHAVLVGGALSIIWFIVGWNVFQYAYRQAKISGAFARLEG
jgi:ABC-2 type transport system permease protein